jgi:hypothetical protein
VIVGTVKKSIAPIASRGLRRKVSQRLAGSGSLGAYFLLNHNLDSSLQPFHCRKQKT